MVSDAISTVAVVAAGAMAFAASILPLFFGFLSSDGLISFVPDFPVPDFPFLAPFTPADSRPKASICDSSAYRTEIVSLDPLLIYIHSFLGDDEIQSLLTTAEPLFNPSQVAKFGQKLGSSDRTSSSAGLPLQDKTVQCVLSRARAFLGEMMLDGRDEIGPPQLVRYTAGQKFNIHHDWYEEPQWAYDGSRRKFNRIASFFAILQDNCTAGETYFPYVGPKAQDNSAERAQDVGPRRWTAADPIFREHKDGGLAFRPIRGNALFWVNLHANGSGDERTMHAGLPVGEGIKTAMNIWPRRFYPID